MASHTLLCVEPDSAALATIRGALEPHGFLITNITNGEEAVAWGRQNQPDLVIVSVEPRKVGYAICNKFKRSPELKDIPLILTSGEETPAQLEQHRKLKVKANEYLVKPFSPEQLLDKVQEVYSLKGQGDKNGFGAREVDADEDDILLSSDVLEEISIGDSDIVEDDGQELVVEAGDFEDESTQAVSPQALDDVFDSETDAAFAAIEQKPAPQPAGGPEALAAAPWQAAPNRWDAAATGAVDIGEDEVEDALAKLTEPSTRAGDEDAKNLFSSLQLPTRAVSAASIELSAEDEFGEAPDQRDNATPMPPAPMRSAFAAEDDEGPFSVQASESDTGEISPLFEFGSPGQSDTALPSVQAKSSDEASAPTAAVATSDAHDAKLASLNSQLEDLQSQLQAMTAQKRAALDDAQSLRSERDKVVAEREELSREIDEIKSRPQSPGSARDREILSLREVINKKERDLLDIRDQLDARERQILDHKDRIRENERSRRDLEDKNLGLEKALMDANERVEAVTSDKQKSAEREKVLKARLDDAHVEIQKAHDEVESLKKRGVATEERLRAETDRIRGELEGRILEMEEAHRGELAQAAEERAQAEATFEQEHHDELSRLRLAHAGEIETAQRKASEDLSALDERMQAEVLRMRKDHDKATASQKEEHALQLAAEREAHQTALDVKERDHRNEILGMRRRHEEELRAADERRQKELEEAEARNKLELETAENRRRTELQARDEQHNGQIADMDRHHFEEKTQTAERHRAEMDEAHARAARAEGDLAARTEELSEAHRRIAGLEADLDTTRADLRDREVKLSQNNLRLSELEHKTTQYEEQIMRSYQRLRSDDKVIEKAKRALAVALSLLEERGMAPASNDPPGSHAQAAESQGAETTDDPNQAASNDGGAS